MKAKRALVLGASGLVGAALVNQLLLDPRYVKVTCLLRKPLQNSQIIGGSDKLEPIVVDYAKLEDYQGYFAAEHIFVCLGTTIKKAGSKAAFRKVDFEYVHVAAQLARDQRASSFVWISSVGASARSSNFYLKVKGELENAIFSMSGLNNASAVRPSLLLGERQESRFAENLGINLSYLFAPLMIGRLAKYKPIHANDVAAQMISLQKF
jgi:uncharacterized protein YbjT (DUF2867 family)